MHLTGLRKSGLSTSGLMFSNVDDMMQFIMFILKHRSGILSDTSRRLGLGRTPDWTLFTSYLLEFLFRNGLGI